MHASVIMIYNFHAGLSCRLNPAMSENAELIAAQLSRRDQSGSGAAAGLSAVPTAAARAAGGVELVLGWCFEPPVDLDDDAAFPTIRTFMGGYALRRPISAGRVSYFPARAGGLPALLAGPLRPDVVVLAARPTRMASLMGLRPRGCRRRWRRPTGS
jgi:hypothetical protein